MLLDEVEAALSSLALDSTFKNLSASFVCVTLTAGRAVLTRPQSVTGHGYGPKQGGQNEKAPSPLTSLTCFDPAAHPGNVTGSGLHYQLWSSMY